MQAQSALRLQSTPTTMLLQAVAAAVARIPRAHSPRHQLLERELLVVGDEEVTIIRKRKIR